MEIAKRADNKGWVGHTDRRAVGFQSPFESTLVDSCHWRFGCHRHRKNVIRRIGEQYF
jgi:hypothetical protein